MTGWLELPSGAGFGASSAVASNSSYYKGVLYGGGTQTGVGANRNYSYLYQYSTYTSLWVAYPLYSGVMSSNTMVERAAPDWSRAQARYGWGQTMYSNAGTTEWKKNPFIDEAKQVNVWDASYNVNFGSTDWSDTQGSDYYARGHQIPNADRSEDSKYQTETYYATNSTPQIQNKFNSSIWSSLETAVRSCARGTDTVYVVTGAAFQKGSTAEEITYIHPKGDPNKRVPVPNHYWKVLLKVKWSGEGKVSSAMAVGVWIPHQQYEKSSSYTSYVCSVSQIEQWTGFSFFANLPSSLKSSAKSNSNWTTFQNF